MESVVVKPDAPPVVVATLESSSSCCLVALLEVPTVSNLIWGEHSTFVRPREKTTGAFSSSETNVYFPRLLLVQ